MWYDSPRKPGAKELRSLAAQYHSRAETAEPCIAKVLTEIADDLELEARKQEGGD
jgi:hypothetical protein